MAGEVGFEPTISWARTRRLTTWPLAITYGHCIREAAYFPVGRTNLLMVNLPLYAMHHAKQRYFEPFTTIQPTEQRGVPIRAKDELRVIFAKAQRIRGLFWHKAMDKQ